MRERQSLLIWGPTDAGKTALVRSLIAWLPDQAAKNCLYWTGPTSRRDLAAELIHGLFLAGDPTVRKRIGADGDQEDSIRRWLRRQSSGRLRNILISAAEKGRYSIFLDHFPPATHAMARLMNEIIWRCKTPVYLIARGNSPTDIGQAWSIYFAPEYCIHLGALPKASARELLELSIRRFGLASLDLDEFREEVLRVSGHLPGCIAKMCELAASPRYRFGERIKVKLVHVDYLMRANPAGSRHSPRA
jgi:hypothetical protein